MFTKRKSLLNTKTFIKGRYKNSYKKSSSNSNSSGDISPYTLDIARMNKSIHDLYRLGHIQENDLNDFTKKVHRRIKKKYNMKSSSTSNSTSKQRTFKSNYRNKSFTSSIR